MVGEPLVLRLVYGLASSAEAAQARLHLDRCHRCEGLYERLVEWREKAATMLPAAPAIEGASPGTLERLGQRVADAVGSAKQQVFGFGAQAKQQATATYYRAVDPTPFAGVRPSAVVAMVANCITIGGGAAAYCSNQGLDPIGAATGLINGDEDQREAQPPSSSQPQYSVEPAPPVYESSYEAEPPPAQEAPAEHTTEDPQPEPQPAEKQEPTTTSAEVAPAPVPEQEFEPVSPEAQPTEAQSVAPEPEAASPQPSPSEPTKPAPVKSNAGAEFEP